MSNTDYPRAVLKKGEERRILRGHAWIYRNELEVLPQVKDGDVLDIFSASGRFLCRGFFQAEGGIAVRVFERNKVEIAPDFLAKRFNQAFDFRQRLFPDSRIYRWIFGESDGLPGLIVDRYDTTLVMHSSCAFYDRHKEELAQIILKYEGVRTLLCEFPSGVHQFGEPTDTLTLTLDGVKLSLTLSDSQKTGLFLDQRENYPIIRRFAHNAMVFDGFCYHGLWGIHACLSGAASVTFVDTSSSALAHARRNITLNEVASPCTFLKEPVMKALKESENYYDIIVLDPPAFAKSRQQINQAARLYEELNAWALQRLAPNGILITCSCSHFIPREFFLEILKRAVRRIARRSQILSIRGASPDHPILPIMPETDYLKCVLLHLE